MTPQRGDEMTDILCGDAAKVLATLPADSIDLTVTSPPYDNLRTYNGYVFDFPAIARELYRVTKPGGVVVWVVGDATINGSETGTSFRQALYFMECGFNCETMIYEKPGGGAVGNNNFYWQCFEYMFVFSKGTPRAHNLICDIKTVNPGRTEFMSRRNKDGNGRHGRMATRKEFSRRTNVWRMNNDGASDHPAPFPKFLARDHILSWSNPGDLVLDPMCGSGTTLKMAKETGRRFIGIDISEEYCTLARKRVAAANVPLEGLL
jgi:DNA modification methylase